jgi:hypothetical protein
MLSTASQWKTRRTKMARLPDHVGGLPPKVFDALALLNVYFHADLAYKGVAKPGQRKDKLKMLQHKGRLLEVKDVEEAAGPVHELYCKTIEAWVEDTLPETYAPTYDVWGARCIAHKPGWKAPYKDTWFAGDSSRHYMSFDSTEALVEYTDNANEVITDQAYGEA